MRNTTGILIVFAVSAGLALADAQAGKAVYDKSCKSCHGADGTPNPGMVKALKTEMRHLGSKEAQAHTDAELKTIIGDGKGKMKAVKTVSGPAEGDVIAYMRTLKK